MIGLVQKSGGFAFIIIFVGSTWLFLGSAIEYNLPLSAFNKFYGEVSTIDYKYYECMGSGRYRRYRTGRCEMTDINLKNIHADFHIASEAGEGGYLGNVEVGDTITILRRHWYQYPLTFGSINDIYHLEKDGEIMYYYGWRKSENYGRMIVCGLISVVFFILFLVERQTHRLLAQGKHV